MKKNRKRGIIFGGILCLLIVIAVFLLRPMYEQSKMNPIETKKVNRTVFSINNGFVNCYAVRTKNGYVLVDAGDDSEATLNALKDLGIKPEEIKGILLTHTDGDHIASLSEFKDVPIYLGENEVQMIDGTTKRNLFSSNEVNSDYITVKDEESFVIDGTVVTCYNTPGHTLGSVSYLVNENHLFVGDSLSIKENKVELFNSYFNMDDTLQRESKKKIKQIDADTIYTGHYGVAKKNGLRF